MTLAADLAARTGAPPPAGVDPEAYVAGVAAERRRRDTERAFGAPAGREALPDQQAQQAQPDQPEGSEKVEAPPRRHGFAPPS